MRFKITVKNAAARNIERVQAKLANGQALMANIGKGFEITLQRHFRNLNKRPNKCGWRKTNFWSGIAKSTTFVSATNDTATVAIQEGKKFAAKLFGAKIHPTGGRKFLAIPAIESRYGISPSSLDKNDLSLRKTRRGGLLGKIRSDGSFEVHYFLVRSANTPRQSDALPNKSEINTSINRSISNYLK